jgi:hypothetical protein
MTQAKWDKMSKEEKAEYLKEAEHEIKSQQFMNGKKKVGDYSAVSRRYKLLVGGITMSTWCETEEEARKQGKQNLKSFV